MTQAQPNTEKLSDHIGKLSQILDAGTIPPERVADLVEFHRRYLPHLQLFAADLEFALTQAPGPTALSLAAAASMRFYRRLSAPAAPIGAKAERPTAEIISLDRFRRPAVSNGSAA